MISIICCYNDEIIFNKVLLESLKNQEYKDYELIAIDNTSNVYSSASRALNNGIDKAIGESLMVVHQDFRFCDEKQLGNIVSTIGTLNDYDLVGAAGAILDEQAGIIDKIRGKDRKIISSINHYSMDEHICEVETLDECCFVFKRKLIDKIRFDEINCNSWDLYGVDLCLTAKLREGKIYVIPVFAEHLSIGKISIKFYWTLYRLIKKYKGHFRKIITTCIVANINELEIVRLVVMFFLGKLVKRIISIYE